MLMAMINYSMPILIGTLFIRCMKIGAHILFEVRPLIPILKSIKLICVLVHSLPLDVYFRKRILSFKRPEKYLCLPIQVAV